MFQNNLTKMKKMKPLFLMCLVFTLTMNSQTNTVKLGSAKQVLLLLKNDLSQVSSYINGITEMGYHTTGNNNAGGSIYTSSDNDWIIYNAPFKNNDTTVFGLIYYSREIDNLGTVLSYLDEYSDSELYNGYSLDRIESKLTNFYFSENKSEILNLLVNGKDIFLDNSKYYIHKRGRKNTLFRGIRLVNKTENEIVKPYYTAFVYIQQEVSNQVNTNQDQQEGLSDEYKESEFHGQEEIQYNIPLKSFNHQNK
jgi:hypothetical protein